MTTTCETKTTTVRLALPKGRMQEGVQRLMADAGIEIRLGGREYRPTVTIDRFEAKILKPQNIAEMLDVGSRDVGFVGADWVAELDAGVVELLDTGLDPVRLVAAAPADRIADGWLSPGPITVASEYERLARRWIADNGLDATFVRSFGATEVFPPEDADCIVDNTATGATLRANNLEVIDEIMTSTTRLYANPRVLDDPVRREYIERLVLLLQSVLEARRRVMVELNVPAARLPAVIGVLPCMREPTVSPLHGGAGFAVRAAVPRDRLHAVIHELKQRGGTDIVVTSTAQIIP